MKIFHLEYDILLPSLHGGAGVAKVHMTVVTTTHQHGTLRFSAQGAAGTQSMATSSCPGTAACCCSMLTVCWQLRMRR